ncbi:MULTISPECIES: hypothetical protein [unclassified Vibrio]|nr:MULTISPECIES: hypothetical protein [unclassified Vibrio]
MSILQKGAHMGFILHTMDPAMKEDWQGAGGTIHPVSVTSNPF